MVYDGVGGVGGGCVCVRMCVCMVDMLLVYMQMCLVRCVHESCVIDINVRCNVVIEPHNVSNTSGCSCLICCINEMWGNKSTVQQLVVSVLSYVH